MHLLITKSENPIYLDSPDQREHEYPQEETHLYPPEVNLVIHEAILFISCLNPKMHEL